MMTSVIRGDRRLGLLTAVVVGAAVLLAACGQTSYTYVKNSGDKTYLKLPRSWEVLDAKPQVAPSDTLPAPWQQVFDAAEPASLEHTTVYDTDQVTGRLTVFYVGAGEADSLSTEGLRTAISPLKADPISLTDEANAAKGRLLDFKIEARKGGLRGSRVVYELVDSTGSQFVLDQTSLIDPKPYTNPKGNGSMFKIYALSLHCKTACYEKSKAEINDVVTSWTVIR